MAKYDVIIDDDGIIMPEHLDKGVAEKLFEEELDTLHSKTKAAHNHTQGTAERERFERELEQWREALKVRAREALWPSGIVVDRVTWNHVDGIFRIIARDREHAHRDYSVEIQVSEALSLAEMHDRAPLAAVVQDVVTRVREARDHYLARMQ